MNILFIHNGLKSFVRSDLNILRASHNVREVKFTPGRGYLSEIADGVMWCDLVFGWWATWHMLYPVVCSTKLGKPVVVIGGDYDIIFERQFRSRRRLLADRLRRYLGYYIFPRIDSYITFSDYSRNQALKLPYIIPERVERIYCGLPDIAAGRENIKDDLILTVGIIHKYDIFRKGYGTFVRSARYLPKYKFSMIGSWEDDGVELLRSLNNENVSYLGYLSDEELYKAMGDAKVYVQVSSHEGFGMALAEAMLFQCAPVITNRGSIPEVVGDCGLYVPYGDPQKTALAIQEALERHSEMGVRARERILSHFPIEHRKNQLLRVIEEMRSRSLIKS